MLNFQNRINVGTASKAEIEKYYSHDAVIKRLKTKAGNRWNRKTGRAGQSLMPGSF
jgi:hypothetical protein